MLIRPTMMGMVFVSLAVPILVLRNITMQTIRTSIYHGVVCLEKLWNSMVLKLR
jgi:hypothetical protein